MIEVVVKIVVKGAENYWRFTIVSWLFDVKDVLEGELNDVLEIRVEEGDNEDPALYVNGRLIGMGVPGEEGYLIEIIKKAIKDVTSQ